MSKISYSKLLEKHNTKQIDTSEVVNTLSRSLKGKVEIFVGGSVAKGTNLGSYDVDVFVRFNDNVDVDLLEKVLKKHFNKVSRVHGSRDYFNFKHKGISYEIIPVLKIEDPSKAENITDVSYFHVEWVKKHLKNPEDVKIAKIFCEAQGVYGAESYINGFSGYILEILIAHYGSFENLIRNASNWKPKVVIDIAKHYLNVKQAIHSLNNSKTQSPLIIIDPVDKNRNASAALSEEMFSRFVMVCKEFVKSKNKISFFKKKKFKLSEVKKRAKKYDSELVAIKITPLEGKEDIAYTKALVAFNLIKSNIMFNDFNVIDSKYEVDENMFWFIVSPKKLSKFKKHLGPKVWGDEENINKFKLKHKDVFLDGTILAVMKKRKFVDPKSLVKDLIKRDEVKKRVSKLSLR